MESFYSSGLCDLSPALDRILWKCGLNHEIGKPECFECSFWRKSFMIIESNGFLLAFGSEGDIFRRASMYIWIVAKHENLFV